MSDWVLGRRGVREHLVHAPDTARALWVARGSRVPRDVIETAEGLGLPVRQCARHELTARVGSERHQGVALEVGGWSYADPEDFWPGWGRLRCPWWWPWTASRTPGTWGRCSGSWTGSERPGW